MSSFISSSERDRHGVPIKPEVGKRYLLIFVVFFSIALTLMVSVAVYIQPLEGELTRLGSYAERDFGWNAPQKKIRGTANMGGAYDGKSDVLVIGDSFSTNGVWQPFFGEKTGLSYETLDLRKTSVPAFLESTQFITHPPRVVIVQCVERELIYFFRDMGISCVSGAGGPVRIPLQKYAAAPPPEYYVETRKTFDLMNINLKYAASVALGSLVRGISGTDTRNTKKFALTDNRLFSNRESGEILVYEGDMDKLSWTRGDIEKAACALRGLQDRVQSAGKTLFIFMLAPDKSTAYADYISPPIFKKRGRLEAFGGLRAQCAANRCPSGGGDFQGGERHI